MHNPKEEKTLVLIKPDGVKRGLVGEVISRIEQRGLKLIALKMIWADDSKVDGHYPKDAAWVKRLGEKGIATCEAHQLNAKLVLGSDNPVKIGCDVRSWLVSYLTSGPMIAMIIKGIHSVTMVRKLVGPSVPANAEMGTIRGDFSVDSPTVANAEHRAVHNLVHASETSQESAHEIKYWFSPKEIHDYKRAEEDIMF
ncbi:MAG: nucleoside-diphosphate kinase [Candidatus Portnoybacteria bacterium CG06_land_8_20_14_3_00_39_12]|uniref:nucleoside-diphosphate kinase n=2 Tax=Candidatus Portnoyibacteriota TaxID=1817913 RepID=A0A2M7AWI9_9BACT|nr:MAG: nucleoside-diphosphate kinase [Parcubacteria group bacterium CG1_02_40_25]PIU74982.1 MAG: nucleoside-diphosphate kinase [Candidatus Portnoybacteria bacterium CG06_land_8_20_14_3_00_39_12]